MLSHFCQYGDIDIKDSLDKFISLLTFYHDFIWSVISWLVIVSLPSAVYVCI